MKKITSGPDVGLLNAFYNAFIQVCILTDLDGIHSFLDPHQPVHFITITIKFLRYLLDKNQFFWCSLNPSVEITRSCMILMVADTHGYLCIIAYHCDMK
jgi:hypothetical protein